VGEYNDPMGAGFSLAAPRKDRAQFIMTMLDEITSAMEKSQRSTVPIDGSEVRTWLSATDIETLGAAYSFIMEPRLSRGITPPLTLNDHKNFLLRYYERCFLEDLQSKWASSRYSAGWDLANWIQSLWGQGHKDVLGEVKVWLAKVYREGDSSLRECIINATLEHVFSSRAIAKFFLDWALDPILQPAYSAGLDPRQA
jgi:hypothetical protein